MVLGGDRELFADLVEAHQVHVYRLCLALVRNRADAEDAAQAALLKAFRGLSKFKKKSSFRTWLTRIAINQCKDAIRAKNRRKIFSLDAMLESLKKLPAVLVQQARMPSGPDEGILRQAWARLEPSEREILEKVRDGENLSYEQIATDLRISVNAVKGRLKRARTKLKKIMLNMKGRD